VADTKKCPFCAETIAASAKKCRFCNERLDGAPSGKPAPAGAEQYKACPKCELQYAKMMGFTWWGGVVGPKLLTHVKCENCGTQYNGNTGQSNTTGIVIYTLVALVLVGGLMVALAALA
jgi:hypothetical protein